MSEETWVCPECESKDTQEFVYDDDFGSRKCNKCVKTYKGER